MAEVVWSEPAVEDLDAVADYIALENPSAARELVRRVLQHVERLGDYPLLGPVPPEFATDRYRQIVEPPCRVFYRIDGDRVLVLHVMRGERIVRPGMLERRAGRSESGKRR